MELAGTISISTNQLAYVADSHNLRNVYSKYYMWLNDEFVLER